VKQLFLIMRGFVVHLVLTFDSVSLWQRFSLLISSPHPHPVLTSWMLLLVT